MRVFITGATGYIGGAVAIALTHAGHEVGALVRPDADAKQLRDAGVAIVAGDLASLPSMGETLAQYDAFVHAAQPSKDAAAPVRAAVETFNAQQGHLIYTSGVWVLGNTTDADENSPVDPIALVTWRPAIEELALAGGGAVIRPGCVYGGKQSLLAGWFAAAEQEQPITIIGDGENHWAYVDVHELAELYVRAVEQRATGILHGIDDSRATMNEVAAAIDPNATVTHVPLEEARANFGPFADALAIDQVITSQLTREKLGWKPSRTMTSTIGEQWKEWREATKG